MDNKNSMGEHYGLTLSALCKLMEYSGQEAVIEINKLGGVEEICEKLGTSPSQGLTSTVEHHRDVFGSNTTSKTSKATFLELMWNAFYDQIIIILLIECFVLFCDGFKLMSVVIVVLITATVDYYKERKYQCFRDDVIVSKEVTVIRNSVTFNIVVDDVVVGDVCIINNNNFVPADGILIESNGLKIDESSINGRSGYTRKTTHIDPMILCGSEVIDGNGVMVVTAVGVNTCKGKISSTLMKRMTKNLKTSKANNENSASDVQPIFSNEVSVLQQKLIRLFWKIVFISLVITVLMFVVIIAMFLVQVFVIEDRGWRNSYVNYFIQILIICLNVFSLFIPEGIPITVVIVLAISIRKLNNDKILVRRLGHCETMGNVTSICFDKTGTLTTNKMVVVESYICGECQSTWTSEQKSEVLPNNILNLIAENISINSSVTSMVTYNDNNEIIQIGNNTECSLLDFVKKIGLNFQTIRDKIESRQITHVFPFNSDRKLMGTVIPLDGGGYRLFVKGASELVLSKCKFIFGQNGKLMELSNDLREHLICDVIKPKTSKRLRTISLAYRDFVTNKTAVHESYMNDEPYWPDESNIVKNLTCLCVLFIEDSIRSDVPDTIKNIKKSGVTVRMITGDDIDTAKSVALQCGIIETNDENIVLDSLEFNQRIRDNDGVIRQHLFDQVYPTLRVLARASPIDKYNLVDGIINSDIVKDREVVAMVGDGDGDALALRKADVGITFNQFSSDVAKDASDIILIDDKFGRILNTLAWGRNSYDSIAKFIQFILSVKLTFVIIFFFQTILISYSDYDRLYIFWTDLFLNIAALVPVYFTHNPTDDALLEQPHRRNEPIISKIMFKNIVGQSIYQLIVLMTLKIFGTRLMGSEYYYVNNLVFYTFVMMTLFNMFNARKLRGERNVFDGLHRNIPFCLFWIVAFIFHVLQVEYNVYAGSLHMHLSQWFWSFFLGVGILLWQQGLLVCIRFRKSKRTLSMV